MSSNILVPNSVIRTTNLKKKYRLYAANRHRLYESLTPFRRWGQDFWALKGLSFEVGAGEVIGIVGRNGSGKSTLLQILAGVLTPTSGTLEVKGRIAALLELGAGFNPELTGRENAKFVCTLQNVNEDFDEVIQKIQAFADLGQFFDQPVKTYSSGMFVRLAFATSIHVDPDIFLVDEALSVGDVSFQEKCYRKINDFKEQGKTIVFVTHDMESVMRHCRRVIVLNRGEIICDSAPRDAIKVYYDLIEERVSNTGAPVSEYTVSEEAGTQGSLEAFLSTEPTVDQSSHRKTFNPQSALQGSEELEIVDFLTSSESGIDSANLDSGSTLKIYFKILFKKDVEDVNVGMALKSHDGILIYSLNSAWTNQPLISGKKGEVKVVCFFLPMSVNSGTYFFDLGVDRISDQPQDIRTFEHNGNGFICLTRRISLFSINVSLGSKERFHGFFDLRASYRPVTLDAE